MDEEIGKIQREFDRNIEKELTIMENLNGAQSSNFDGFSGQREEKNSLVPIYHKNYEIFEKLKKTWNYNHNRIKDFNQKKLQKYQQQFRLKYMFIADKSDYTFHKRITALSKYTVIVF